MKFVPVPGTEVLFSIWETRVQDFEAFVRATNHDATGGMYSNRGDGWKQQGDTWRSPGFPQSGAHPVVGVSWDDAQAFCRWLTEKERREGRLRADQSYRLARDWEWSVAVGLNESRSGSPKDKDAKIDNVFPWGTQWPPPRGAGNYADEAAKRGRFKDWSIISGFDDGFDATAPVGSFNANRFGLYDMGGNVWEWVEDFYDGSSGSRALRGASFVINARVNLLSSLRNDFSSGSRSLVIGFRVVCVVGASSR
jgi:formylglycine-generating enzyme required for sulfatase activity